MELRLKEQKGPRHAPHPWSQRAGDLTWEPSRLLGSSGQGKRPPLLSCSSGMVEPLRPPLLISPASLVCSQGPMRPGGVFRAQGTGLGAQQALHDRVGRAIALLSSSTPPGGPLLPASPDLPDPLLCPQDPHVLDGALERGVPVWELNRLPARVGQAIALRSSPALPGESLPLASLDLPSFRGADPVWPPLLLPSQSPYVLLVHLGVPPISLGVRVPHQRPGGALVAGRCSLHVFPHHHPDSTSEAACPF